VDYAGNVDMSAESVLRAPEIHHEDAPVGKFCQNCGVNIGHAKFCPECGTPAKPDTAKCGKCGFEPEHGVKFCPECGNKL
jgi:predicted amidophosphoribosyltransferase